jgi:hypothetical protein
MSKSNFRSISLLLATLLVFSDSQYASADTYDLYYGTDLGDALIINRGTGKYIKLDLFDILSAPNAYGALAPDPYDPNDPTSPWSNIFYGEDNATAGFMTITDIRGSLVYMEGSRDRVQVYGELSLNYGRKVIYDMETGEIIFDQLIAHNQEDYDFAKDLGLNVYFNEDTADYNTPLPSQTFQSFSPNSTTNGLDGGLITNQVTNADGQSVLRSEEDGTVHLGENSLVFAERGVAGFREDTMYSSNGVLHIGDNSQHRTVINGTLEIQDPTQPNQAVTKRYSDSSNALAMAIASLPRSNDGRPLVSMGTGYLGGESAFAFGFSQSNVGSGISFNANLGYSQNTDVGLAMGVGYSF